MTVPEGEHGQRSSPPGADGTPPRLWRGFRLGEVVERGGMLVSYRAERVVVAGSEREEAVPADGPLPSVLVRTLSSGIRSSPELIAALEGEALWLGRLRHPLVPRLLECHLDAQAPGLVLEDAGGHRLDAVLSLTERLERPTIAAVGIEVAGVLSALHREGRPHGRLRPSHVELCADGTIRLHGIGGSGARGALEAVDDELLFGPDDLAPEQLAGGAADVRTDVYLFGLLLQHMRAGETERRAGPRGRLRGLGAGLRTSTRGAFVGSLIGGGITVDDVIASCLRRRPSERVPDIASAAGLLLSALRAETTAPTDLLIARALGRAGLAPMPDDPAASFPGLRRRLSAAARRALGLGAVLVVGAVGALAWWVASPSQSSDALGDDVRGVEQRAAQLRVLAEPWAEIHVDGKLVDTTPIGRPIEVAPGRHQVRFRHPQAPDQLRTVEVIAGQTVWIDVTMPIVRPPRSGSSSDASADESP